MIQFDELLRVLSPVIIFLTVLSVFTLSYYLERYFTILVFGRKMLETIIDLNDRAGKIGAAKPEIMPSKNEPAGENNMQQQEFDINEAALHYKIETDELIENLRISIVKIGSIATLSPYIGLFGTVIGIMNSFSEIAKSGTSNFAYVSKGISEALIATAAGLFLAILASFCYNHLTSQLRAVNNSKNTAFEKMKIANKGGARNG